MRLNLLNKRLDIIKCESKPIITNKNMQLLKISLFLNFNQTFLSSIIFVRNLSIITKYFIIYFDTPRRF